MLTFAENNKLENSVNNLNRSRDKQLVNDPFLDFEYKKNKKRLNAMSIKKTLEQRK